MNYVKRLKGFTLIELIIVIGIIGILTAIVIIAVNPGRQIASANNAKRSADVLTVLNAVTQYAVDNGGVIPAVITTTETNIGTGVGFIDLTATLVTGSYISALPTDPQGGTAADTKYAIKRSAAGSNITTVNAPLAQNGATISVTR